MSHNVSCEGHTDPLSLVLKKNAKTVAVGVALH